MRCYKQRRADAVLSPNKSLENLPDGILRDLLVGLTPEEELFDLQGIQLGHICFIGIAGQNHHVGDLTDLQTAAFGFIEGHPAGVVGTHLQGLLYGDGFCPVVAGFVDPGDGIGIRTGAVGAEGLDDAMVCVGLKGIQLCCTVTQDGLQIIVRLVGSVDKGTPDRNGDAVFGADSDTSLREQTGVDDGVPVIGPGEVIKGGFQCPCGLIEGGITDGVDLDLHSLPVGFLAEIGHLFVGVIQHTGVVGTLIRFQHGGIGGAEAPVQSGIEAAADPGESAPLGFQHIHGLEVYTHLQAIAQTLGEPILHVHIQIHGVAHAADGMDHTDAFGCQMVGGELHIAEQLHRRNGAADIVRKGKERLLIHLSGVLVIAPEVFRLLLQDIQELRVHNAGVAVVLDHEQGLVRADLIQLLTGDELLLRNRVGRRTEGNDHLVLTRGNKRPDHVQNLGIASGIRDIQPSMESGKAGEMDVTVAKGRNQRTIPQLHTGTTGELGRQLIAHIDDPAAIFHQILVNMILRIAGQDGAFVDFHGITSH